ncbi:MAG: GNAT family N-acetyltransferase [Tardiphaga sp.]
MLQLDVTDPGRYSDLLLLPNGQSMTIRFADVADGRALQAYFRGLSPPSRYNRLMGAASELPAGQLDLFIHFGQADGYSVLATTTRAGQEVIAGEARYAFDQATSRFEFGLSVSDAMQRQGIGTALISNMECRAAAYGADRLFGDTLRSNGAMVALARKAGFALAPTPGDWKQMRFEKAIDSTPAAIPCASWRLAAHASLAVAP